MFHKLHGDVCASKDPLSVGSLRFEELLLFFGKRQYNMVPLKTAIENVKNGIFLGFYALTFDDCFESVFTHAYPMLRKHAVPFTLFITTSFLGRQRYITKDQLLTMAADPLCTVGSHTETHLMMRSSPPLQNRNELVRSKAALEALCETEICFFAFPYGSIYACSERNTEMVKENGYQAAFSTICGVLSPASCKNLFLLPRININDRTIGHFMRSVSQ